MPEPHPRLQTADLAVPRLGVGVGYQPELRPFIEDAPEAFDFLEVVPDILWHDFGHGRRRRYVDLESGRRFLAQVATTRAVVPHSIGLSIGSAHRFDRDHVAQMARWYDWLHYPWHSDHLAFHLTGHGGRELNANLTLPLPLDVETLDVLVSRVQEIRRRIPVPFALENNVYYFTPADEDLDEATFLEALGRRSGCGILLDLHNLYVDVVNRGLDPRRYLERLDLDRVLEIHVAGGMTLDGVYLDAHSGEPPEPVWALLDWVLPQCSRVGGVVFELFGSWFETLGTDRLRALLARMRETWLRHQPVPAGR